jgi:hypothetical protein
MKKHYWHVFCHKKLFEKYPQPHCQTRLKSCRRAFKVFQHFEVLLASIDHSECRVDIYLCDFVLVKHAFPGSPAAQIKLLCSRAGTAWLLAIPTSETQINLWCIIRASKAVVTTIHEALSK